MTVTKREGELKSAFAHELKRLPSFFMFQIVTAGWPDRGIVGANRTSFWEFKHATPDFDSPGNQQLFCMRLATHAYCRYVIWWETKVGTGQRTLIVHPRSVHNGTNAPESYTVGFNHTWLVEQIRKVHHG